jgi:hypothetical protein
LDIDYLTAVKDDQELRLEKGSEALRTIKGQNEQVCVPCHVFSVLRRLHAVK